MLRAAEDRQWARYRASGDPAALGAVFDRTAAELLRVARHLVHDAHVADDLLQQTFLTAIEVSNTFDDERRVRPWLLGILVRLAARHRRDRKRAVDPQRLPPPTVGSPFDHAVEAELSDTLQRAIAALPASYRPIVELHVGKGQSAREIAEALGMPAGTVRTYVVRGMRRLRRALPPAVAVTGAVLASSARLSAMRRTVLAAAHRPRVQGTVTAAGGSGRRRRRVTRTSTMPLVALAMTAMAGLLTWWMFDGPVRNVPVAATPTPSTSPTRISAAAPRADLEASREPLGSSAPSTSPALVDLASRFLRCSELEDDWGLIDELARGDADVGAALVDALTTDGAAVPESHRDLYRALLLRAGARLYGAEEWLQRVQAIEPPTRAVARWCGEHMTAKALAMRAEQHHWAALAFAPATVLRDPAFDGVMRRWADDRAAPTTADLTATEQLGKLRLRAARGDPAACESLIAAVLLVDVATHQSYERERQVALEALPPSWMFRCLERAIDSTAKVSKGWVAQRLLNDLIALPSTAIPVGLAEQAMDHAHSGRPGVLLWAPLALMLKAAATAPDPWITLQPVWETLSDAVVDSAWIVLDPETQAALLYDLAAAAAAHPHDPPRTALCLRACVVLRSLVERRFDRPPAPRDLDPYPVDAWPLVAGVPPASAPLAQLVAGLQELRPSLAGEPRPIAWTLTPRDACAVLSAHAEDDDAWAIGTAVRARLRLCRPSTAMLLEALRDDALLEDGACPSLVEDWMRRLLERVQGDHDLHLRAEIAQVAERMRDRTSADAARSIAVEILCLSVRTKADARELLRTADQADPLIFGALGRQLLRLYDGGMVDVAQIEELLRRAATAENSSTQVMLFAALVTSLEKGGAARSSAQTQALLERARAVERIPDLEPNAKNWSHRFVAALEARGS